MRQYFLSFFRSLTPGLGKRACPSSRRTRSLCRWRQTPSEVMLKETSFSFTLSCFRNAWHSASTFLLQIFIIAVASHFNFFINTGAICKAIGLANCTATKRYNIDSRSHVVVVAADEHIFSSPEWRLRRMKFLSGVQIRRTQSLIPYQTEE